MTNKPTYQQLEQTIQEMEQKAIFFQYIVDNTIDWEILYNKDWKILYSNNAIQTITGYSKEDYLKGSVKFQNFIHPEDLNFFQIEIQRARNHETITDCEFRIIRKNKSIGIINLCTQPCYKNNEFIGARITLRDITNFKSVEELFNAKENAKEDETKFPNFIEHVGNSYNNFNITRGISEHKQAELILKKLQTAVESAKACIVITDYEGNIEYANPYYTEITGYTPDEYWGKNQRILKTDFHDNAFYQNLWNTIKSGQPWEGDFYNRRKNGDFYWVKAVISPITNQQNEITHFVAIKTDITENKKKVEELSSRKKYLENLINYANEPIIVWNTKLIIQLFNKAFERLTGYSSDYVIGKTLNFLFPMNSISNSLSKINETLTGNYWETIEIPILCKNDETRVVLWNSANIYDSDNKTLISTIAQGHDITERRIALQELIIAKEKAEQNEARLKIALNASKAATWEWNIENNIFYWSDAFYTLFGLSKDTIPSVETWSKVVYPNDLENILKSVNENIHKKELICDYRIVLPENEIRWIKTMNKIYYNGDIPIKTIGLCMDITEHKNNDLQLIEAKESAIFAIIKGEENERSRLAQELHDGLGPLMTTLKLYMQTLQKLNDIAAIHNIAQNAEEAFRETLQTITEVSNNISPHILRNFGLFSGIKSFIEKKFLITKINFNFDCKFTERIDELYEITLYRVITELINNSIKYSEATDISLKIFRRNNFLYVKYNDSGKGFDIENVLKRSKGMGLYNIQNRIRNIHGTIKFEKLKKIGFVAKIIVKIF